MIQAEAIPNLNEIMNSNKMYRELIEFLDISPQNQAEKGLFISKYVEPSPKIVIIDIFSKQTFNDFNKEIKLRQYQGNYEDKSFSIEEIHNLRTRIFNYYMDLGFNEIKIRDDNKIAFLIK